MKKVFLNFRDLKPDKIVYCGASTTGKYRLTENSPFRIKYVGDQYVVAQGLNVNISLGEYVFDINDIENLNLFEIDFR